ncbi:MAG: 50S ribosomal protein L6 [Clostridia bacterium]
MSRIGNKAITVPAGVEVKVEGNLVTVKGPKGTLTQDFDKNLTVTVDGAVVKVERASDKFKAVHGLTRTLVNNMITGVTEGFQKVLEINGIGYKAQKQGTKLVLTLGYSHPVEIEEFEGISIDVPSQNSIVVKGINKQVVGQLAADIRSKRPPEPYKGKGIKYTDEVIKRKEGKAGGKK